MEELLRKLVEAHGPSGFEDAVRQIIKDEIEDHADEVFVDAMGNQVARKQGNSGLKIMLAAHMDEIGVMVTHVTEKGFLRFTNIGGLRAQTLMGARVVFSDGTVGVVHSEKLETGTKLNVLGKHFIDVGASSRDDCPIEVGEAASFVRPLVVQGARLMAKSMDDRIGCAIVIEAMRRLASSPHNLYFVFSVQEEVGTRGAQAAANALAPDVGIAIDITKSGDTPNSEVMAVELGSGPAIKVKDAGMISHAGLVRQMRERAEEANIPYQMEVLEGGSTDARSMQIAGAGCAAGCISIPCRYAHSQSEVVDANDVENSVQLLLEVISKPISL